MSDEDLYIRLELDYTHNNKIYTINSHKKILYHLPKLGHNYENTDAKAKMVETQLADREWIIKYCDSLMNVLCQVNDIEYLTNQHLKIYPHKSAYISIIKGDDPLSENSCYFTYRFNTEDSLLIDNLDSTLITLYNRIERMVE